MKRSTVFILIFISIAELALYFMLREQIYTLITTNFQIKATDIEINFFAAIIFTLISTGNIAIASKIETRCYPPIDDKLQYIIEIINQSLEVGNHMQVVYSSTKFDPQFKEEGELKLSDADTINKQEIINNFDRNYTDDPCAVVLTKPNWNDFPLTIRYFYGTYAEALSLRLSGQYVGIISANVLMFSKELQCVVVHRRSDKSYNYAGLLHTFGGAFIPPKSGGISNHKEDHRGIQRAAIREIFEESDIGIHIPLSSQRIVIDEFAIQFIQLTYLGINVTAEQVQNMTGNWEGEPVQIPFSELENKLLKIAEWTPTGWVHVILWLALEAKSIKFGKLLGSKLIKNVLQKTLTPKPT